MSSPSPEENTVSALDKDTERVDDLEAADIANDNASETDIAADTGEKTAPNMENPEADGGANTNALPPQADDGILPVVGLGGSAGSIRALQQFFLLMPPDTGMAFVVVLHLSPDHESLLPSVLASSSKMPVVQAGEAMKVEPNRVYVIPPSKHLTMRDGHIELTEPQQPRGKRVAVDLFFRTLAASHRSKAVAVVLSGGDSDGAIGIKRIKEHGGVTIAQDPADAEHDSMPRAAIETGMVDWVLPVTEMPTKLVEFIHNETRIQLPPAEAPANPEADNAQGDETALREVLAFLHARTGHDFAHYKRATVLRRVARRLQVNSLNTVPAYLDFLRTHPGEAGALLQDLLISVTNFFRDPEGFSALENSVPELFRGKRAGDTIRVWVPGCATGEEAYSLAMILCEYAGHLDSPPAIQIFATDIDHQALQAAREGLYPTTISADVSPERLRRFFTQDQGRYRIRKDVREMVLFASHNLLKDAPFSRLDLVSCRNLLIYFERIAQERVFDLFHFALRPKGLLFLGASESTDETSRLFTPLDKKHRIYARRAIPRQHGTLPSLPLPSLLRLPETPYRSPSPTEAGAADGSGLSASITATPGEQLLRERNVVSFGELHLRLLEQYGPPSVLVNEDYDIVHLSERAGRFLHFTGGNVSINLLTLVHPALRLELRTALFRAKQTDADADVPGVIAEIDGEQRSIDIKVRPTGAGEDSPTSRFLLVMFEERDENVENTPPPPVADDSMTQRLETELKHLKEYLRGTVEQHDASSEELTASNEELQAMNEELRSTGEELETSKEELEAANEELITVNQELKSKVEEISRTHSDLQNLMSSTDIATIFLDRELCIKRYTPRAVGLFHLIPTDTGRPILHLRNRLDYAHLIADAERVLDTLVQSEQEVRDVEGNWFLMRMLPYRTQEDKIDGVVMTFVDITRNKATEESLRRSEERFRYLIESGPMSGAFFNASGVITEANDAFLELMGYSREEVQAGQLRWDELTLPEWQERTGEALAEFRATGRITPYEKECRRRDGSQFWGLFGGAQFGERGAGVTFVLDVTERKQGEDDLRRAHDELKHNIEEHTRELEGSNAELRAEASQRSRMEKARRRSEERFLQVFYASPIPLIITTADDGRVTDVNESGLRFFDLAREDVIGTEAVELGDWSSSMLQTRSGSATREEVLRRLQDSGAVRDIEVQVRTRSGKLREAISNVVTMESDSSQYLLTMFLDITARKQSERARELLLRRLVGTQEEERRRLSRELHDQMGQQLTALMMGLKALPDMRDTGVTSPTPNERIEALQDLTTQITTQVQQLARALRPAALDNIGLDAALRQYVSEWGTDNNVRTDFVTHGLSSANRLPGELETTLYRIVQEALTNVTRHAGAAHVSVLLETVSGEAVAIIEDNGKGFDAEAEIEREAKGEGRLGLLGMRERIELAGGSLTIESTAGKGTAVYARVPIESRDESGK